MKCVKKNDEIKRVSNEEAFKLVKEDGYHYVPKHVWKELKCS